MNLFESVNRLLQDKHTLTEAKTVLRVTFDNGMKKNIEFKGSFEAGKKAYLGKNVKAISKDKTPVMLKAVKVEPINESKRNLSESVKNFEVGIYPREDSDDAEYAVYDKKSKTWSDFQGDVSEKSKHTAKKIAEKYNKGINESKELEPIKTFKVTYHDGSSYKTSARAKSEEDFKKYLTQDGPWVVTDEDEETGKETKKKIVKVEMLDEGDKSNELKDGDLVFYNDGQDWLKGKLISDEQISTTGDKFWYVDSFANRRTRKDIKTPEEMQEFRNKKLTGVKQI
jgi:hypothetical protein